jgi:tetratricopeptide (TPR) repeat protein
MTVALAFFLLAAVQDAPPDVPSLLRAGDASYLKADYEAARQSFQQAWDLAQETPPDNPARYDILKRLTSARAAAGEFKDADQFLQMAINWRETTLGAADPKIPDDMLLEVSLCRSMKDHERAADVLMRVLGMHIAASGFDSKPVADDYSRMAQIRMDQKLLEQAVSALNMALNIRTKLAGALDPSLVPDLDRLGQVYITQRAYDNAEWAFQRALVIRESIYGKMNADLIATVDGLAYALFGQKKYEQAEPLYKRLIDLWVGSVGGDHPMVAMALDKVAVFYAEQKRYAEANEASDRAHAIRAGVLATSLIQDATRRYDQDDMATTRALLERCLKVLDPPNQMYDKLHEQVLSMMKVVEPVKAGKKKQIQ